jgi:hypothetical protein
VINKTVVNTYYRRYEFYRAAGATVEESVRQACKEIGIAEPRRLTKTNTRGRT